MSNPRYQAIATAGSRTVRTFNKPLDEDEYPLRIQDFFGARIFSRAEMQRRLPKHIVKRYDDCLESGATLDRELADAIALFDRLQVLSPREMKSRYHVTLEQYITNVEIELAVLQQMIDQSILPAAISERTVACSDVEAQIAVFGRENADLSRASILHETITELQNARGKLQATMEHNHSIKEEQQRAEDLAFNVAPAAERVRSLCDSLELLIDDQAWTLPRYQEMLFQN